MTLMDSTLMYYKVPGQVLFYETYPKRDADLVTYLAGADTIRKNRVAYLWPTSGMFSALNALQKTTYNLTKENLYLEEAQRLASACGQYFFEDFVAEDGESFKAIKNGNVWFVAIMLRGFEELYKVDRNPVYLNSFKKTLQYMWEHNSNQNMLFDDDCFVEKRNESKDTKWLLTQAAMIEMYARLAKIK